MTGENGPHTDPGFEDLMRRLRERDANPPPEGRFAEYRNQASFSSIDQVLPIALDKAPDTVESVMISIPWGKPNAPRLLIAQTDNPSSLFRRAIAACMDEPEAPESDQAFNQLADYVRELPADITRCTALERAVWTQKTHLFGKAYTYVIQRELFDQRAFGQATTRTPAVQGFMEALEQCVRQTGEILSSLENASPLIVMQLMDAHHTLDEVAMASVRHHKVKTIPRLRSLPQEMYELMGAARSEAYDAWHLDLQYVHFDETLRQMWDQLQADWTWQDMNQVLHAFSGLQSSEVIVQVIDAVEDASEAEMGGTVPVQDLAIQGLTDLIHFDIHKNLDPRALPPALILGKDEISPNITIGNVTLPREHAPTATISLLSNIAEKVPPDTFTSILERIQATVYAKPNATPTTSHDWLLTLALLRKHPQRQVQSRVNDFIAREDFPNYPFQQIITYQKVGYIYLTPSGRVRVDTRLANGWPLAKSSVEVPTEEPSDQDEPPRPQTTIPTPLTTKEKGPVTIPGLQPSKRQRQRGKLPKSTPTPNVTKPAQQPGPTIAFPEGEDLISLGGHISQADLAVVAKAIADNQEHGRHPLIPLRGRAADGTLLFKMRVNGRDNGIRIVLTHTGRNRFEIQTIQYRGAVYKSSPFS